eukprot:Polyplicarium_translucidae@DN5121_c0_g1_i1.p1
MLMGKIGAKSAAFINHKPFHPGRLQNIEKVWIAQEKDKKERAEQEELLERRKQEVRIEELRKALRQSEGNAHASGRLTLATEGMEWMYENPAVAAREREQEEYRLGKKIEEPSESGDVKALKAMQESTPGTLFASSVTRTTEDTLRKMREDPLFAIRQAEHQRRRAVQSNPFLKEGRVTENQVAKRNLPPTRNDGDSFASCGVPERSDRHRNQSPPRGSTRSRRSRSRSHDEWRSRPRERCDRNREREKLSDEERNRRIKEMEDAGRQHETDKDSRIAAKDKLHKLKLQNEEVHRANKGGRDLFRRFDRAVYENVKREDRLRQRSRICRNDMSV